MATDTFSYRAGPLWLTASVTVADAHAGGADIPALLATGNWVTFESLMTPTQAAQMTTSVDNMGGMVRRFAAGVMHKVMSQVPNGKGIILGWTNFGPTYGTYEPNEPGWTNGDQGAIQLNTLALGVVSPGLPGNGWDDMTPTTAATWLQIKEETGPNKNVCGAWFKCGYDGSVPLYFEGIHFRGQHQGWQFASGGDIGRAGIQGQPETPRVFTNLFIFNAQKTTIRNCLSTGWAGTNGAPPGETFGIQLYTNGVGGLIENCATDGRRKAGGPIWGSVGITTGNSVGVEVVDCYSHHNGDAGFVAYQAVNGITRNLVLGDPDDRTTKHVGKPTKNQSGQWVVGYHTNGDWLNHERTAGWKHYKTKMLGYSVGRSQREHISHSGDAFVLTKGGVNYPTANGSLELIDPEWANLGFGGKIAAVTWGVDTYNPQTITSPPKIHKGDGTKIPYRYNNGSLGGWTDQ